MFPSYYEAFPAVPFEAMACGVPVISSDRGGLPEIVGDAAITVSPTNVDELSDDIIQVLSSNRVLKNAFTGHPVKRVRANSQATS